MRRASTTQTYVSPAVANALSSACLKLHQTVRELVLDILVTRAGMANPVPVSDFKSLPDYGVKYHAPARIRIVLGGSEHCRSHVC